jgi:peptide/nickel transport system ATP-binding protein
VLKPFWQSVQKLLRIIVSVMNEKANIMNKNLVLKVDGLSTHFIYKNRTAKAVRDVSFTLEKGKTLAVVGESGSGKSVTALSIMGLLGFPGEVTAGKMLYRHSQGNILDLSTIDDKTHRKIRGAEISMIFQEPMTSLNPLFTIGNQISEMVKLHDSSSKKEALRRAIDILDLVEIPSAKQRINDYPHQLSGGMRQRVMIAIALICNPALLIADEPTTALDVTIQAQILDLMRRLQAELSMSILFITHSMGVVAEVADEVAVMYAGEVVEQGKIYSLFDKPSHPYTQGLLASIPNAKRDIDEQGNRTRLRPIEGIVPSVYAIPQGCTFAPRCQYSESKCRENAILAPIQVDHLSRCWKSKEVV